MAIPSVDTLLCHLRQLTGKAQADHLTDRQLLLRFIDAHDQEAFQTLVQRHGPMVLGLCRRLLRNAHDADDAFQATFIILVRRARSLNWQDGVGPWLYQVAHRVVRKVQAAAARRQTLQREVADVILARSDAAPSEAVQNELHQRLHEELDRLPTKYRAPLVLCYLQGKTHEEAAQELGLPRGSMARRLGRGQEMLKDRLLARGATLTMGLTGLLATEQAALPAVPASLLDATVSLIDTSAPALPGAVATLVEGVMHAMFLSKLRLMSLGVFVVGVIAGGLGLLWSVSQGAPPPVAARQEPATRAASVDGTLIRPWVVWSGANSQVADAAYRRITSSAEWQSLWLNHAGKTLREAAGEIPQIDFQQAMVVAVFQGAQHNCRGVLPVSVTDTPEALTIRFVGDNYQTLDKADSAKTFGFFLLPRSAKPLVLEENTQSLLGQPPVWKLRVQFDAVAVAPGTPNTPAGRAADANMPLAFDRDVRPILQAKCGNCHAVEPFKGKFDCRTYDDVLKGGVSGSGIVPGLPDESEVWNMIGAKQMPPWEAPQLTAAERQTILQWIKTGARPNAVTAADELIRERLKRIADQKRAQESPLSELVRQTCRALVAREVDMPRRFVRPGIKPQQENDFKNQIVRLQRGAGIVQFKLDTHLEERLAMADQVANEPKEWQANYAYAVARLAAQIALVYEYNAQLGQLRSQYPEIDLELHRGWQLVEAPRFTDRDAENYAKMARQSLDKLAKENAKGDWEEVAKSEAMTLSGLAWKPWPRGNE